MKNGQSRKGLAVSFATDPGEFAAEGGEGNYRC